MYYLIFCNCSAIQAVFKQMILKKPKQHKKQSSNGSHTSTSISAILSVSHVEIGCHGELTLYVVICSFNVGLSNVLTWYVAGFDWHVIFQKILFCISVTFGQLCKAFHHRHKAHVTSFQWKPVPLHFVIEGGNSV